MKNYKALLVLFIGFYGSLSRSSHVDPLVGVQNDAVRKLVPSVGSAFTAAASAASVSETIDLPRSATEQKVARYPAYLGRVEHYEKNVFKRPLTDEEKELYCGHLLERD
jgi:hypothetical protein